MLGMHCTYWCKAKIAGRALHAQDLNTGALIALHALHETIFRNILEHFIG